jgi:hypothetical protein
LYIDGGQTCREIGPIRVIRHLSSKERSLGQREKEVDNDYGDNIDDKS